MSYNLQVWAEIKQLFDQLQAISPVSEKNRALDEVQRDRYVSLLWEILNRSDRLKDAERHNVEGLLVEEKIPGWVSVFIRDVFEPNYPSILAALEMYDEGGAEIRTFGDDERLGLKRFIEECIDDGYYKAGGNEPSIKKFLYEKDLNRILYEPLYGFEPSLWLRRARKLELISTSFKNESKNISSAVDARMKEVYQCYVHGQWMAVIVLSRSVLEAVIWDSVGRLDIDIDSYGELSPSLHHLITDVSKIIPDIVSDMETVKSNGNNIVHPRKSKKETKLNSRPELIAEKSLLSLMKSVQAICCYR